jgi:ATP-dependent DNA ligase
VFSVQCPLVPMVPTLVRPPFHREGWVYEEKVDGWRVLAYKMVRPGTHPLFDDLVCA